MCQGMSLYIYVSGSLHINSCAYADIIYALLHVYLHLCIIISMHMYIYLRLFLSV